jgi:serine/threonine protein kinase
LNPGNVFIDERFEPKIGGFANPKGGDSNASSSQTSSLGTPLYQEPEILEGELYGREIDIYAFGILFNATITGQAPYEAMGFRNQMLLVTKVMGGVRPTLAAGIPPGWAALIERCWDRDSDRHPTFEAIVAEMSNGDFVRPAVDVARFLEYQKKVVQRELWCHA